MNITELDNFNLKDAVRFHNRLNPRLWDRTEHLHAEVQQALLAIADDFREFLGIDDLEIKDITISGSNAAYNYTPHSDIDLHLVVDIPEMNQAVYRELFNAKKYQYNNQHNITIGPADVELYVQLANEPHVSQGIYSVLNRDWISVPRRKRARINDSSVRHKYEDLEARIKDAVSSDDTEQIQNLIMKIRNMRQSSLETNGEFGTENLVFKLLRTNGLIQELYDALMAARDRELSLKEQPKKIRYGFGEDAYSTPDGVAPTTCMFLNELQGIIDPDVIERFFQASCKGLNMQEYPRLILINDPSWSRQNASFGRYDPDTHTLELSIVGRHEMDVLRTMAHELTHARQNELGMLDKDSGETGSPEENQANAVAGQLMRHWGRDNPHRFAADTDLDDDGLYENNSSMSNDYYDQLAQKYAKEHNVPLSMVRHVMNRETGHITDPTKRAQAQSKRGAQGIMQLKPITQREMGVTDPHDPEQNIRGGVQYLGKQLQRFKDPVLAMAAYNAGPANVEKYGGVPPFRQTQGYVQGYQPDPVTPQPEPAQPGVLDTIKKTGYEWLRGAGDLINRATAPKSLDPNTMKPLKEKRLVPYRGEPPVDDPEINPLRDRLNRGEHPGRIEKDIRKGAGEDVKKIEHELAVQREVQRQLEREKADLEKKLKQLKSQPRKEPEKERDVKDRIVDVINQITAPPKPFPGAFGSDDIQREQTDSPINPEPQGSASIQGGLNLLKKLHGLSRITRAGVEDELSQEFKNWVRRQGGATDQPTRLPLPDINRNTTTTNESSGYIPTEKEKTDPRFKMALTVDIKPGETGRQANRMALQTDSQGRPALLRASGKK